MNNNLSFHRLVGAYRLSLAAIADGGTAEVVDNMIDPNFQILKVF